MKVYSTSTKTEEMEEAIVCIGMHCNEAGEPLVVVNDRVWGTPAQVRASMDRYEQGARERAAEKASGTTAVPLGCETSELAREILKQIGPESRQVAEQFRRIGDLVDLAEAEFEGRVRRIIQRRGQAIW